MVASRIKKLILRFLARRTRPLPLHRWQALPRRAVKLCSCHFCVHIVIHIAIGAQKFMRKYRGHFVFWQSARELAHSKTLHVFQESSCRAQRPGLRRPSAAFPRDISNRANDNWNCYSLLSVSIRVHPWLQNQCRNCDCLLTFARRFSHSPLLLRRLFAQRA